MGIADELFPKAQKPTETPPPAAPTPAAPEPQQERSFMTRAKDWLVPRGPEGIKQVEHRDFKFLHEMPRADLPIFSKEARNTGTGLMFARDVEGQANVIRKNLGVDVEYDKFGHPFFEWKGQGYYVNPPGLQQGDVNQLLGQVAGYGAAGRLASGGRTSPLGRMTRTGGAEAGYSVAEDKAGDFFGADQGVSPMKAAFAGFGAALFEGLSPIVINKMRKIIPDRRFVDPATGTLTDAGKAAARRAGLDPAEMSRRMNESFAGTARDATSRADLEQAGGYAQGDEFGIPYTRGQASGDFDEIAQEQAMRQSATGEDAGRIMREFDERQARAIEDAAGGIQDRAAGGSRTDGSRPRDMGDSVRERVVGQERIDNEAVDDAYADVTRTTPGETLPRMQAESVLGTYDNVRDATPALRNMVNGRISGRTFDAELTPRAVKANEIISRFIQTAKKSLNRRISPFTIRHMETTRRKLNLQIENATTPTDRGAAIAIRDAYDDWWDQAIDAELMTTGDANKWGVLKQARRTAASYHKRYSKQGRRDPAGNVVERIIADNPTGEQVVNWVFGNSMLRADGNSVAVVQRLKEIGGEDVAQQLRELAWVKLTRGKNGELLPAARITRNVKEAFENASSLMDELFPDSAMQAEMKRYGAAVAKTVPPAGATNPSGTAPMLARLINGYIRRAGSAAVFSGQPLLGGILYGAGKATTPGKTSTRRAREMVTPPRRRPRPPAALSGAAGAVSGQYGGGLLDDDPSLMPY